MDAIAAHYDSIARERGVTVAWQLDLPEQLPIPEVDVCSVLGSLAQNAIEAAGKAPTGDRWVEVVSQEVTAGALGLVVRNPYRGTLRMGDDGLPITNVPGHGVGLASVSATARRYDGMVDVQVKDNELLVSVVFYHNETGPQG